MRATVSPFAVALVILGSSIAGPRSAAAQDPDAGVIDAGVVDPGVSGEETPGDLTVEPTPLDAPAGTELEVPSEEPAAEPPRPGDEPYDLSLGAVAAPDAARVLTEDEGIEGVDVLLFVPRAILFVPKLVLTGLFFAIDETIAALERSNVLAWIDRILYWNDDHTFGWSPVVSYDTTQGPTAGVNVFHDDLLGYDESLRASARFGGRYFMGYGLELDAERFGGTRLWLTSSARYERNPALVFHGIGLDGQDTMPAMPGSPRAVAVESFYDAEHIWARLGIGYTSGRRGSLLQLGGAAVFHHSTYGPTERDEVSIETVYDTSQLVGFDSGVTNLELRGIVRADTREVRGLNGSGFYLEAFGGAAPGIDGFTYAHYGAEANVVFDLFRSTRLLSFRLGLEGVHGAARRIPFTVLPRLGGADRLRGWDEDRFRDNLSLWGSVEYRYPIHQNVLGVVFFDAGTVAESYGDLFDDVDDFRAGGGFGLLIGSADSVAFRLELSYGDGLHFFLSTDVARAFDSRSPEP
jgi:outer membrane protein assembly factor BamA